MVLESSRFPSTTCWIQRVQEPGSGPPDECGLTGARLAGEEEVAARLEDVQRVAELLGEDNAALTRARDGGAGLLADRDHSYGIRPPGYGFDAPARGGNARWNHRVAPRAATRWSPNSSRPTASVAPSRAEPPDISEVDRGSEHGQGPSVRRGDAVSRGRRGVEAAAGRVRTGGFGLGGRRRLRRDLPARRTEPARPPDAQHVRPRRHGRDRAPGHRAHQDRDRKSVVYVRRVE